MSARAAWRLIGFGFSQVFRYTPGKLDWMANGLPMEGNEVPGSCAGDLAQKEAPTCLITDRMGDVKRRAQEAGWNTCVVVINPERIVLGLVPPEALEGDPQATAEQVMDRAPRTYRLNTARERTRKYFQKTGADYALVTTSDGELFGILKRAVVEKDEAPGQGCL